MADNYFDPGHLIGHVKNTDYFEVPRFIDGVLGGESHPDGRMAISQPLHRSQQILDDAQQAAKSEAELVKKAIEAAKNEALGQLAARSVDTAVELAGKIFRQPLSTDDHAQLIHESFKRFPSKN